MESIFFLDKQEEERVAYVTYYTQFFSPNKKKYIKTSLNQNEENDENSLSANNSNTIITSYKLNNSNKTNDNSNENDSKYNFINDFKIKQKNCIIFKRVEIKDNLEFKQYLMLLNAKIKKSPLYQRIQTHLGNNFFYSQADIKAILAFTYIMAKKNNFAMSVDILNAFYTINVEKICDEILIHFLNTEDIEIIKKIYINISNSFNNNIYLFPGIELSNFIFNLFVMYIYFNIFQKIKISKFITFTDDCLIMGSNIQEIEMFYSSLEKELEQYNLRINKKKTFIFDLNKDDVIFLDNLMTINKSQILNASTCKFLSHTIKKKINQQIYMSENTLLSFLKYGSLDEYNILKKQNKKNRLDYLENIKHFLDIYL